MSNDPIGGLLGSLSGGKGGFGKILQDLLGAGAPGRQTEPSASDKANIPLPDSPESQVPSSGQGAQGMTQPGRRTEPDQGMQPGQTMPDTGQRMPDLSPSGHGMPRPDQPMGGQPGMRDPTSGVSARPMPPGPTGRTSPTMPADKGNFSDLLERFRRAGLGSQVDSWVSGDKANESITPDQVNRALGAQQVQDLARTAGVSPDEICRGLARAMPEVVNELTPQGHMPTQGEVQASLKRLIG